MNDNPTGVQEALGLHDVPAEKWYQMLIRTLIGGLMVALGVVLVLVASKVMLDQSDVTTLSLSMVSGGVGLAILGASVWSGQLVGRAILSLKKPVVTIKTIIQKRRP